MQPKLCTVKMFLGIKQQQSNTKNNVIQIGTLKIN